MIGGKLLLELNRLLRPGGYFVWSATPVYRKDEENVEIWKGALYNSFLFHHSSSLVMIGVELTLTLSVL